MYFFSSCLSFFENYNRCKTGTPCCGKKQVSVKLTGRVYSEETIELMQKAAKEKARPEAIGQDWRRNRYYREWGRAVRANWKEICVITGRKDNLRLHHFYSSSRYVIEKRQANTEKLKALLKLQHKAKVLRYIPENGIVIHEKIHVDFHKKHKYENNTLDQFRSYVSQIITDMSISSQAHKDWWEGSETNAQRIKRLIQLEKRLEKIHSTIEWSSHKTLL